MHERYQKHAQELLRARRIQLIGTLIGTGVACAGWAVIAYLLWQGLK